MFSVYRKALNRCRALYKIGYSHFKMSNSQHALHYFDQALYLCEDEFIQLLTDIKVCLLTIRLLCLQPTLSDLIFAFFRVLIFYLRFSCVSKSSAMMLVMMSLWDFIFSLQNISSSLLDSLMCHEFNIMTSKSSICSKSCGQLLLFGCMFFITSIFLVYNYCLNYVMLL